MFYREAHKSPHSTHPLSDFASLNYCAGDIRNAAPNPPPFAVTESGIKCTRSIGSLGRRRRNILVCFRWAERRKPERACVVRSRVESSYFLSVVAHVSHLRSARS